jgi:thioredoxin 1
MFCSGCGNQLEDKAAFCSRCGRPAVQQQGTNAPPSGASGIEVCEITFVKTRDGGFFRLPRAKFIAMAIGPSGKYAASESEEFNLSSDGTFDSEDQGQIVAHDGIVQNLTRDGWQLTEETSPFGFNCKFKRIVSKREAVSGGELEIYYFWASWSDVCKKTTSDLTGIALEFPGKLRITKFNVDVSDGKAKSLNIAGIPAYVFLKSGQECERIIGVFPKEKIVEIIRRLL